MNSIILVFCACSILDYKSFMQESNEYMMPFLDILFSYGQDSSLNTRVYSKKTAINSLLKWDSCHPRSLAKGILRGQYLCLRENCSDIHTFKTQASEVRYRFMHRCYPKKVLAESYTWASQKELIYN